MTTMAFQRRHGDDGDMELTPEQEALTQSPFLTWMKADVDYAQTTIYFFCTGIALLAIFQQIMYWKTRSTGSGRGFGDRLIALTRYFSSRQFRIGNYYSPTLGVLFILGLVAAFMSGLTFGPKPYYWETMAMGDSPPLATRSGYISIAVLPFMIALATKINPVGVLVSVSHEKLQVFHRWTALFMYVTSLLHTFPFIMVNTKAGTVKEEFKEQIWWTGVAALVPQTWLIAMSWGVIRGPYYEFFKKMHFIAAILFMAFLYIHCENILTSWNYTYATTGLYFASFLIRNVRTIFNGLRRATVQQLPDNMVHVSIPVPKGKKWSPGQHAFIRIIGGGVGLHSLSSHPFTIANLPTGDAENKIDLVFRGYGGVTKRLHDLAAGKPSANVRVMFDGPYGGLPVSVRKFEEVVLIAGGTGSTFIVPVLLDLVQALKNGDAIACKKVSFILAVRGNDSPAWMKSQLTLAREVAESHSVHLGVHITRAATVEPSTILEGEAEVEKSRDSSSIEGSDEDGGNPVGFHTGRPNLPKTLTEVVRTCGGKLGVAACGPESMLYDVRNTVASLELDVLDGFGKVKEIFLHTEHYDW